MESIEELQQKQTGLQAQLDEVLEIAKNLASKQQRKLTSILEESSLSRTQPRGGSATDDDDQDDEDELIEFQQIENELRISELKRQLANIQEELRLRLYKRLLSNTTNSSNKSGDLERIEEGEEDNNDYYANSEHFRTIYEQKLSPIIQASYLDKVSFKPNPLVDSNNVRDTLSVYQPQDKNSTSPQNGSTICNSGVYRNFANENDSFISSGVNFSKRSNQKPITNNRPLTMYLPKPEENLDLIEHIQTLGHDLNIIASDIKIDYNCAHGYLWKCRSNNSKKWVKRYFHFDRSSKELSYYDNDSYLVKRSSPRNVIPFDEIDDVYVDHKLSGADEKEKSSKGRNYVFVLTTLKRKFTLASSRPETMRAWIDILFTAARANDYFQYFNDNEIIDSDEDALKQSEI